MFINLDKEKIILLEKDKKAEHIALWDNLESAINFYKKRLELYTAYEESKELLLTAYATPVKVYKLY